MEEKTLFFDKLPETFDEFMALPGTDLKDPYATAALIIVAFTAYPKNKDEALKMIDYLRGPAPLSNQDKSFIKDRFMDEKDYVPYSYFKGAVPSNNYTPDTPYTISFRENPYSRDNEHYLKLFVKSGGADNERSLTLREKASTSQWFAFEYSGILMGIRVPAAKDPWA